MGRGITLIKHYRQENFPFIVIYVVVKRISRVFPFSFSLQRTKRLSEECFRSAIVLKSGTVFIEFLIRNKLLRSLDSLWTEALLLFPLIICLDNFQEVMQLLVFVDLGVTENVDADKCRSRI